jgi:hypothetical protein
MSESAHPMPHGIRSPAIGCQPASLTLDDTQLQAVDAMS